jgi:hypothetical protein
MPREVTLAGKLPSGADFRKLKYPGSATTHRA